MSQTNPPHARACTYTHIHAHTRAHAHTRTHTHAHAQLKEGDQLVSFGSSSCLKRSFDEVMDMLVPPTIINETCIWVLA